MRPKTIPLKEEKPLFSYETWMDKPKVAQENAMVISGNSFRGTKFKNAVTSVINCELAREWFGCLTSFLEAVEAAWLEAAAYTAWVWLQLVWSEFSIADVELLAIAWLTSAADRLPYFTGSWTASLATFTSFGRSLVDDTDAATARTTLWLWTLATQSGTFSWTSSGTNTGDQTSIVGITWTKAQFDTACTDGNFAYQSDLSSYLTTSAAAAAYQPLDADLTAFAAKTAPSWAVVWTSDNQTLTTKTIDLASNTLTWTIAQFNTACSDADFATLAGSENLTNKTVTSPTLVTPSAFTTGGTITLAENTSIALDPAWSADGKYSGITIAWTWWATIAFGDLVTLDKDDSRWELVDISVAAAATWDARWLLGMAVTSSTDGTAITVLLQGTIRADANFPTLTIGAAVYASTTWDIVVTQPSTVDHVIRVVWFALTADELYFAPDGAWITHV